jgi:hypothetical protein
MAKKKVKELTPEERFYATYDDMSKVNFLGIILKKYFKEKIIGKDENSLEYAETMAILRILEEKFAD